MFAISQISKVEKYYGFVSDSNCIYAFYDSSLLQQIEDWNKGGWPTNLGEAVIVTNILQLYLILSINGPVYAYYSNGKTHHHLVVVTGVDIDNNIVYTNNPWGIQGEQSFESFKKQVAKNWYSAGLGMVFVELFLVKRNKT